MRAFCNADSFYYIFFQSFNAVIQFFIKLKAQEYYILAAMKSEFKFNFRRFHFGLYFFKFSEKDTRRNLVCPFPK